ncbi:MAG: aminotransferase class V-fold PLP-dependent enzyme [Bacteroidota bacterium]
MSSRRNFLRNTSLGWLGFSSLPGKPSQLPSLSDFAHLPDENELFKLVRQSLLVPKNRIYLNTGSLGPSPRQIVNRISELHMELEQNPVGNNWGNLGAQMDKVRQKVAAFIGASEEEIVLTRNTTDGLNLVGSCLALEPGDEILTTTHEHGGGENGLHFLTETCGATLRKVEIPFPAQNTREVVEAISKEINDRTRVVLISHVSTITGLRLPFAELAKITKPRKILLIADGAQAPGQIPIDVGTLGVDVYASSSHKWLMGPKETGFVYLRKEIQDQIRPVFTHSNYKPYSASTGTRNVVNFIAMGETLDWHRAIGREKIEHHCLKLANYCAERLTNMEGLQVISPTSPELQTGIVSILLDDSFDNRALFEALGKKEIIVKLLPKYNALRFSCHMFNTEDDIDRMVSQLEVEMKG